MVTVEPSIEKEAEVDVSSSEKKGELDLVTSLTTVLQHKREVLSWTLAAFLIALIASFLMPSRYTANARILPPQQNQSLTAALTGQLAGLGSLGAVAGRDLGLKNPNELYVGMLKCRTVQDAMIRRFDLQSVYRDRRISDARADLESASTISATKDGFITIAVEDRDRQRAAAMANAYVEELKKLTQNVALTEAGQRRVFFEHQVTQASDNLRNAEEALKQTQQKTGMIQLNDQAKAIIESVVELRAQIAAREVQIQSMRSFAAERNPDLLLLKQELEGLREQLAKLEHQQNLSGGDLIVPTGKIPEAGLEYMRRLRDVKYWESMFEVLSKQYEVARVDEARQGTTVQVIDPAVEPDRRSAPRRALITSGVTILALLGASFGVLLRQLLQEAVARNPEQEKRLSSLRNALLGWQ